MNPRLGSLTSSWGTDNPHRKLRGDINSPVTGKRWLLWTPRSLFQVLTKQNALWRWAPEHKHVLQSYRYFFLIFQIWPFLLEHLKVSFTSELIQIECPWRLFPIFPSLCTGVFQTFLSTSDTSLSTKWFHLLHLKQYLSSIIYIKLCFLVIKNYPGKKNHPGSSSERYSTWWFSKRYLVVKMFSSA